MTDAVFSNQGTIDKFIGDAIMAYWGAPVKTDQHALLAVTAALEMAPRLDKVNQWLREQQYPELAIGIGLHTGKAILGNIGSDSKLDYTIIGDTVNLASRMEGLTKQYESFILITETTYEDIRDHVLCRIVDMVRVKGKQEPVRIYQPVAVIAELDPAQLQTCRDNIEIAENAFDAYLQKQWQQAIELLNQLQEEPISRIQRERCQHYLQSPPDADWDGVFTMTTK
jgi:adenylate cyclase